jgi:hypothetical protein
VQEPWFTIAIPLRRKDGDIERPPVVVPIIEDQTGRLMMLKS